MLGLALVVTRAYTNISKMNESNCMIRIGTRSSPLALVQAALVRTALQAVHPNKRIEIIPFTTRGDQTLGSLHDIGGKALFTKELQDALLSNKIDIAVHSLKDVETHDMPLLLCAYLPREVAHDVLITKKDIKTNHLTGTLGSCSPRRCAQAAIVWPDVALVDLRGNVGTRLKHVLDGTIDATILAAAGLKRLGLLGDSFNDTYFALKQTPLSFETFIPAAGQGVIALECRMGEGALFRPINDVKTEQCALVERLLSRHLGGNCRIALGVHARHVDEDSYDLDVMAFFEGHTIQRVLKLDELAKQDADYKEFFMKKDLVAYLEEAVYEMAEELKN
ncbi:MAG: hydroxymethylbilane synthase [Candidatus Paracaedibacteraceae bacterium]|nr:hydroxymethylbilane synthase [Candidatus Paracaedibacteraceae bacterium]